MAKELTLGRNGHFMNTRAMTAHSSIDRSLTAHFGSLFITGSASIFANRFDAPGATALPSPRQHRDTR